jgi:hypothetical protein
MPLLLASTDDLSTPLVLSCFVTLLLIIGSVLLGVWIAKDPQSEPPGDE